MACCLLSLKPTLDPESQEYMQLIFFRVPTLCSRFFQYSERTIAGTKTNNSSKESTDTYSAFGSQLDKGMVISRGCHAYWLQKVKVHMELKRFFFMASKHGTPCSSGSKKLGIFLRYCLFLY